MGNTGHPVLKNIKNYQGFTKVAWHTLSCVLTAPHQGFSLELCSNPSEKPW
jgi:hypothetical protein